ncbi:MAG: DEAD/DEAH box helicase [Chromatiaceae bacterium]|nr:DEAD/DEAH box helicase [Chromatiaceae bacterium]
MSGVFDRLAEFIQEYIYRNNWDELRDIQVKACEVIFDTDANLLLSSGTASGKTEAAFLPILSVVHNSPKTKSVDVLYISPLKALINDQFERLDKLLLEADIPVYKWHGDVSTSKKKKLLNNPDGLLQTTPESLQGMLINQPGNIFMLFKSLKFIIIDEIHYFMSNDRGLQLLAVLEQIQRMIGCVPRRVGLSATLGDLKSAEEWLNTGSYRKSIAPISSEGRRRIVIGMNHFEKTENNHNEIAFNYYKCLYDITLNRRTIIYAQSRNDVEKNILYLKKMATKNKTADIYYTHHGGLSAQLRKYAEQLMKNSELPIVVGATLTLELGIDIGTLDRTVQVQSPMTVSSFAQRLGRTGRRGNPSEMIFLHMFEADSSRFDKQYDWDLIKSIAIIHLYVKNKWVEPIDIQRVNYSLLYHQTMCYLKRKIEALPKEMAQYILTLAVFKSIDQNDYKILLNHLINIGHIEYTEEGKLMIGVKVERMINHYSFLAVFVTSEEYTVKIDSTTLGTVDDIVPIGEFLILSGKTWKVIDINNDSKTLFVEGGATQAKSPWQKQITIMVDTEIVREMKRILESDEAYKFVSESGQKNIEKMRCKLRDIGVLDKVIHQASEFSFNIFPWLGTRDLIRLSYFFKAHLIKNTIHDWGIEIPHTRVGIAKIEELFLNATTEKFDFENVAIDEHDLSYIFGKYSGFVPEYLLQQEFKKKILQLKIPDSIPINHAL